jgi:hypothetical protein
MVANAATAAAKWETNTTAAVNNGTVAAGIAAVTVAPGMAAARQADVWAQNVAAAKSKWQANVASVSLQSWQNSATSKGVARMAQGVSAAQPNFQNFMTQLLQYQSSQLSNLPPRGNLSQNITRMTSWVTAMSKFNYNKANS